MQDALKAFDLTGRTALVTGARREIGRAIALGLAGLGARLAIHHAGTAEEQADADRVVQEIERAGGKAQAFAADFAADAAPKGLADAVLRAFGQVDILVLNASIELVENYQSVDHERFNRQITINLRSSLDLLQGTCAPDGGARVGPRRIDRQHPAGTAPFGHDRLRWNQGSAGKFHA